MGGEGYSGPGVGGARLTRPGVATHFQQEPGEDRRMVARRIKDVWQPSVDYHSKHLEELAGQSYYGTSLLLSECLRLCALLFCCPLFRLCTVTDEDLTCALES